jgi:hypothetical protein
MIDRIASDLGVTRDELLRAGVEAMVAAPFVLAGAIAWMILLAGLLP